MSVLEVFGENVESRGGGALVGERVGGCWREVQEGDFGEESE
ncbi:hypothetical protein [Bartonella vinsonii]|nr:hypothetical protein [Bartonella vinsonii]